MRKIFLLMACLVSVGAAAQKHSSDANIRKLLNAEMAISNLYVDSIDDEKLVEDAIRGMLEKLDPHSSYTTAKETEKMNEPLQGSFEGIGVQFNIVEDTLLVIQPVFGGPSEKVGIQAGDRIVSVNDTAIAGVKMSREDIMKRLRGKKGTKVNLSIVRRGIKDLLTFNVTRDKIPVTSVDAVYMIRPGIGYIRITSFGATTYDEFMEGVEKLRAEGMQDLIVDLQDNGGGYLQAAAQIANEFLANGDLIVYTKGLRVPRQEFKAHGNGKLRTGRIVVLTNEYTASASEILSGAIQDQDRGIIVGRRTFGKGLVQRPLEFPDGSMIRLTVAHYYTPSGRCIQKPYVKGEKKDYAEDIEKRFKHGELYSADSIHFDDSLRCYTLRKHRTIYGGGGIMPDYFVPLDTTQYTRFHRELAAKSFIIDASLKYIDSHRKQLKKSYPTFDKFAESYEVPKDMIDKLLDDAAKKDVKPRDDEELQNTLPQLRLQLKALIGRDLWGMSEYFQIINQNNHIVNRALEVLSTPQQQ
ncbi:MAG: S41 family peptidase [Prevotella sp.]|nr:S41 family peptidase [Prevotella sp.]